MAEAQEKLAPSWIEVPFEVQKPQDGRRVDSYLTHRLKGYSRAEVQRLIQAGRVLLEGRAVKPSTRVGAGHIVLIRYPRREEPPAKHEFLPVLYEDEHMIAVNKPGDILAHPTDRVLLNSATSILKNQFPGAKLHLVHRLDRETSGVLLLAKNPRSARALNSQFVSRQIAKQYLALVRGRVSWRHKEVDAPVGREGLAIKVRQTIGVGQPASTEFECLKSSAALSLILARPKTGRLHQIRVHLAHLGHPILGDKLYIGTGESYMKAVRRKLTPEDLEALGARRQMLHAWRLSLNHPHSGAPLEITAPEPEDFRLVAERLP
ncbi:MAG: RluA family pseudouridine synthase [Elusimicrobia bacterium]|nr:RluA family pseudouridine synthase [Elusimicrobiota bacterium]